MEYYQPVPEKKDNTLIKIAVVGVGCLFLVVGIGAFLVSRFYFQMRAPTKILNDHIQAINQGNYELAYTHFSEEFKENTTYQDFRDELELFSSLLPSQQSSFSEVKIVNNKASIEGTLTGRDGAIFPVEYELIKEKGAWKITAYHWTSPGERIRV